MSAPLFSIYNIDLTPEMLKSIQVYFPTTIFQYKEYQPQITLPPYSIILSNNTIDMTIFLHQGVKASFYYLIDINGQNLSNYHYFKHVFSNYDINPRVTNYDNNIDFINNEKKFVYSIVNNSYFSKNIHYSLSKSARGNLLNNFEKNIISKSKFFIHYGYFDKTIIRAIELGCIPIIITDRLYNYSFLTKTPIIILKTISPEYLNNVSDNYLHRCQQWLRETRNINYLDILGSTWKRQKKTPIKIINLERRPDRKEKMSSQLVGVEHEFSSAVDGRKIRYEEYPMFHSKLSKAVIGCAMSHIGLWKRLSEDTTSDYYLIMEDDLTFNSSFENKLNEVLCKIDNKFLPNLLFLHYSLPLEIAEKLEKLYSYNSPLALNLEMLKAFQYVGGMTCYLINKIGARHLLKCIESGVSMPIDNYLANSSMSLGNFRPFLVFTSWVTDYVYGNQSNVDSDIQYNVSFKHKLKSELKVYINKNAGLYSSYIVNLIISKLPKSYSKVDTENEANCIIHHITDYPCFDPSKLNILISGESWMLKDSCDVSIGSTLVQNARHHIHFPQMFMGLYEHKQNLLLDEKLKSKFCAFMYSVDHVHRTKYFDLLSKYKRVDGLGKSRNNTNEADSRQQYSDEETYMDIAVRIYSDYKFVLAIENKKQEGYFTEKMIHPLMSHSIPLYWGDDSVFLYINKKRVIYLPDYTDEQLLKKIEEIDNNDDLYNKIIREPLFLNNNNILDEHKRVEAQLSLSLSRIFTTSNIYLLTFGNTSYYGALKRIRNQAQQMGIFDSIITKKDTDLSKEFLAKHNDFIQKNKRGFGYWIWKSHINLELLNTIEDGDVVVYVDAGCELNNAYRDRLYEYIDIVKQSDKGILSFDLGLPEKTWTKMDIFSQLEAFDQLDSTQLLATVFIYKKTERTVKLFQEYAELSTVYHLIDDSPSILPNDPSFKENRHDQSILSILRKKYGTEILPDETYGTKNTPIIAARNPTEFSNLV